MHSQYVLVVEIVHSAPSIITDELILVIATARFTPT